MSVAGMVTRAVAALVPRLSFPLASGLGRSLGSLAWALDGRHRDVAVRNLAIAFPGMCEARRKQLAQRAFQQAGRTAVEMLWSPSLNDTTLAQIASFEGKEHLDEALERGRGALLTSAHFGNWELMGAALAHLGVPISGIARRIDDPDVEDVLYRLRTGAGSRVIYKQDAVRGALRALRDGEVVAVLVDQNTLADQAAFVPFFGRQAATTRLTAQLEQDRYRFVFEPLEVSDDASSEDDAVNQLTAAFTRQIERRVRQHPEAWLWIHDRWRTRPPEPPEPTAA